MKYSTRIRPISYVKANAAELIRELAENREPLVITQNGEATAVMQDVATYEQTQETLALLKILALGRRQIEEGGAVPLAEARWPTSKRSTTGSRCTIRRPVPRASRIADSRRDMQTLLSRRLLRA